jgi:hypothetical protein
MLSLNVPCGCQMFQINYDACCGNIFIYKQASLCWFVPLHQCQRLFTNFRRFCKNLCKRPLITTLPFLNFDLNQPMHSKSMTSTRNVDSALSYDALKGLPCLVLMSYFLAVHNVTMLSKVVPFWHAYNLYIWVTLYNRNDGMLV